MSGPLEKLRTITGAVAPLLRLDNWQNALTGLGIYGRDKGMSHTPGVVVAIPDETLDALYHSDGIAARLVDLPVDHAMRKGYRHVPPPETDSQRADEMVRQLEDHWSELGVWDYLSRAWKWGRLYGGGYLLLGADDGAGMDSPLNTEMVKALTYLMDLDIRDVTPTTFYSDERSPLYGEPETYLLSTTVGNMAITETVHESRLLRFGGAPTSRRKWRELGYQDYSVLQRPYAALRRFDSDWASASAMMADASVGVLKIQDFYGLVSGGGKDTFTTRMELVNLGLSAARILPIDKEEDFQRIERTFTGVADMLNETTLYLAASAGWPVTVLFGRSPDGLNATGESDQDNWHGLVRVGQTQVLIPAAEELQALSLRALGIDPEGWSIELPELSEESDKEQADRRLVVAQADHIYIDDEVFTPEEVALSRVTDGEWSDAPPQLDAEAREAREALLAQDLERMAEEPEEEPGTMPPAEGGPMPPAMVAQQEAAKAAAGVDIDEPEDDDDEEV